MPRILIAESPSTFVAQVYTPDFAVGDGGRNLRKDVLLVQFFLASAQRKPEVSGGVTRDYSTDAKGARIPVSVDGVCGPRTIAAIRRFHEVYDVGEDIKSPASMIPDARVDPAAGAMFGPRQGHILSIARLNMLYRTQFGPEAHLRLFRDALFPKELHDDFYVS